MHTSNWTVSELIQQHNSLQCTLNLQLYIVTIQQERIFMHIKTIVHAQHMNAQHTKKSFSMQLKQNNYAS